MKNISCSLVSPYFKKLSLVRFIITILLLVTNFPVVAMKQPAQEYQLKAVFLFNFTQFVDWPPSSFDTDQSPVVIGVLGDNPFGSYLDEIVSGESIRGHPVVVHYYKNVEDVQECHILFVTLTEITKRKKVIEPLKGKDILTVSDALHFAAEGGMIRFFIANNNIKFQINLESARASKMVFSSKLLRLAEIYKPG
ncbi:MAG TPA: YfiR family protein [Flavitalea sp.]|nr:YfiR family protein [Flavitalea sp.]